MYMICLRVCDCCVSVYDALCCVYAVIAHGCYLMPMMLLFSCLLVVVYVIVVIVCAIILLLIMHYVIITLL